MIELISILFLIGTVGALEAGNIGIGQVLIQSSIALAILYKKQKKGVMNDARLLAKYARRIEKI